MELNDEVQNIREKLNKQRASTVSIALFGQPGAGKSSLINKIVGRQVAEVGVETDKTTDAARYHHNGIDLIDLPGYGTRQFPKSGYAERFSIMSMDLFLCVVSGKLHEADSEFFRDLQSKGKVCIFVSNMRDQMWEEGIPIEELEQRRTQDIRNHAQSDAHVVFTSCRDGAGLDTLVTEIHKHLDGAKRERWERGAKAYSEEFLSRKKAACEKYVAYAAVAAAANGLNPVPGANVAVDLAVLTKLFREIRSCYGLDNDHLLAMKDSAIPAIGQVANNVLSYATKEGSLLLLKRYAGREVARNVTRYVPFVGQLIASGIGYAITSSAGFSYLNDCHQLAESALESQLTPC